MENKELKFKTTLNCSGCVSKVQNDLDNSEGISTWAVDTEDEGKILTISSHGITEDEIIAIVRKKGFKAERIDAE